MAILEVELRGKIDDLKSKLKVAEKQLKETGYAADESSEKISKSGKKAAQGMTIATDSVGGLLESVVTLTKGSSSLTEGLKKVGGALSGSGGVLIGVTAVTAAVSYVIDKYKDWKTAVDEVTAATATLEGKVQGEIQVLNALFIAARDETKSKESRARAITKINSLYGDYLPKLTQENIDTRKVAEAVDALSVSLLRQAKIRGIQAVIEEKYKNLAEEIARAQRDNRGGAALQLREQNKEIRSQITGYSELLTSLKAQKAEGKNVDLAIEQTKNKISELANSIKQAGQEIRKENFLSGFVKDQTSEARKDIEEFSSILKDLIGEDLDLSGIFTGVKPPKLKGKKLLTAEQIEEYVNAAELEDAVNEAFESLAFANNLPQLDIEDKGIDEGGWEAYFRIEELERITREFNSIMQTSVIDAFAGIGEAIGTALAEGENLGQALAKTLLGTVGNMLVQLGELAISTGIGILAVQTALETLNPYVAIAAGVALVAIGSAFKSGASNIGSTGGSSGSVSGQGSRASFGGSSFSSGSSGGFGGGQVVFKIAGQDLIGVLSNTQEFNARLGSNG